MRTKREDFHGLRLLAGILLGSALVVTLNASLLLFTPVGGMPLEGAGSNAVDAVLATAALLGWSVAVFGAGVLACRVAGRMEGLVSVGSAVLGTLTLVGVLPKLLDNVTVAYLQLGSIILGVPLLFVAFFGGIVAFYVRRPDAA